MGPQCRALRVTASVADLTEDDAQFRDAIGTWLLGHTERIDFGTPRVVGNRVVVNATLHTPCRYLATDARGARCTAHGFAQTTPRRPWRTATSRRPASGFAHQDGTVTLVHEGRVQAVPLSPRPAPPLALPTLQVNPCAGAQCRTADNRRGAACCRDLTLDVILPAWDTDAEALLAARQAPYVCKVTRVSEYIVECEVISACGYLEADGESCSLHDRVRPGGAPAKPSVCSEWPDLDPGDTAHPGCRLVAGNGARHTGNGHTSSPLATP